MVSLLYLKHAFNESDESLVERRSENVVWQFCSGQPPAHDPGGAVRGATQDDDAEVIRRGKNKTLTTTQWRWRK